MDAKSVSRSRLLPLRKKNELGNSEGPSRSKEPFNLFCYILYQCVDWPAQFSSPILREVIECDDILDI